MTYPVLPVYVPASHPGYDGGGSGDNTWAGVWLVMGASAVTIVICLLVLLAAGVLIWRTMANPPGLNDSQKADAGRDDQR